MRLEAGRQCLIGDTDWFLLAATISDTSEASVEQWIACSGNDQILARIGWHGEAHIVRFDRQGKRKPRRLTLGRVVLGPGNVSADGRRIVTTLDQPTAPPELHVGRINATGISLKKRTGFNDQFVKTHTIAKPTMNWVRSADGTRVQTWCFAHQTQSVIRASSRSMEDRMPIRIPSSMNSRCSRIPDTSSRIRIRGPARDMAMISARHTRLLGNSRLGGHPRRLQVAPVEDYVQTEDRNHGRQLRWH